MSEKKQKESNKKSNVEKEGKDSKFVQYGCEVRNKKGEKVGEVEDSVPAGGPEKSNANEKKLDYEDPRCKNTRPRFFLYLVLVLILLTLGGILTLLLIDHGVLKEDLLKDIHVVSDLQDVEDRRRIIVESEESAIIDVVENSKDAVVSIAVSQIDFDPDEGIRDRMANVGSGFIVDSSGIIITNQHVVSGTGDEYKVIAEDGEEYEIEEILRDHTNDIALLNVDADDLPKLTMGDSDDLVRGQLAIAIGTPLGEYAGSVTQGVISGLERSVTAREQGFWGMAKTYEDVIQTDAAVNPGNSGGPLLDSKGDVIGVNFATTQGAENISFALPINSVRDRVDEYRTYGKFIRPYLGIEYQMISEFEAMYYDDLPAGALIRRVESDSPADKAGLERLDIITKVDGEEVGRSFADVIQRKEVGQEIEMEVWRDGEEKNLTATLEEMD